MKLLRETCWSYWICSHFTLDNYLNLIYFKLRRDAVLTLFDYWSHAKIRYHKPEFGSYIISKLNKDCHNANNLHKHVNAI